MDRVGSETAQSFNPGYSFNWIFLVELLVCGILTLFFLFYFNRLFATLLSYAIRAYTWRKFQVYIDIQALQISLLGGRIFFKGVRYHGENETFIIQQGYITWNYWLRAVRQADCAKPSQKNGRGVRETTDDAERSNSPASSDEADAGENGSFKAPHKLPSRISISVTGFEWFIYNRTPAYEAIISSGATSSDQNAFGGAASLFQQPEHSDMQGTADSKTGTESPQAPGRPNASFSTSLPTKGPLGRPSLSKSGIESLERDSPILPQEKKTEWGYPTEHARHVKPVSPLFLTILPIFADCQNGSVIMGNGHTKVILTLSLKRVKGSIDASSSGPLDVYRQLFDFEVERPVMRMKPNPDYRQPQDAAGRDLVGKKGQNQSLKRRWNITWRLHSRKRNLTRYMRGLIPYFRTSVESFRPIPAPEEDDPARPNWPQSVPGEHQWLGLTRYLDENERDDHEGWSSVEYARFSSILDCPRAHITFYWDVPGKVQRSDPLRATEGGGADINLADPPGYGLDLVICGGELNYGPWADRARAELQANFLPNSWKDAFVAKSLRVGENRVSTSMRINVHIENELVLRVPTKESTKDWQWKGRAGALRGSAAIKQQRHKKGTRKKNEKSSLGPDARPFGWLELTISPNSSVAYEMDMVAGKNGYHNDLEIDLRGTTMSTSVNHGLLWSCGPQKIAGNISNPLGWNTLRNWSFDIHSTDMILYPLRDHIFLLIDLVNDFTSGPPVDFLAFVPFRYRIKLEFANMKLFLNVNDFNIVDNPSGKGENLFLALSGDRLDAIVEIPLENYSPSENQIVFNATAQGIQLDLARPVWNTTHNFSSDLPTATMKDFSLDGRYNYCSGMAPSLTDSLFLNMRGTSPKIYLSGSLIRLCMRLKDNYFGDDMHFRTLEEYQQHLFKNDKDAKEPARFQNKKDNDLDVILNVVFEKVKALLPANIYSRKENLCLNLLSVETDARFTNYYMDIGARFSPIEAGWESVKSEEPGMEDYTSSTQVLVDGVDIHGHRLFGFAPSEPTYVCNWDFDVGKVSGECSTQFVRVLVQAVGCFAFTLSDDENTLPFANGPLIHDLTFLRARLEGIEIWLGLEETALLLKTNEIRIHFNDWVKDNFSERFHLDVRDIEVAAVDYRCALRHREHADDPILTHAVFRSSIGVRMVTKDADIVQKRMLQQAHLRFHDQRTHRTTWLLSKSPDIGSVSPLHRSRVEPPAMPVPQMPIPLSNEIRERTNMARSQSHTHEPISLSTSGSEGRKTYSPNSQADFSKSHIPPNPKSHDSRPGSKPGQQSAVIVEQDRLKCDLEINSVNHDSQDELSFGPKLCVGSSNPWRAPHSRLLNLRPNLKYLPEAPADSRTQRRHGLSGNDDVESYRLTDDETEVSHTKVNITFGSSFRGYASPKFFAAVATLARVIRPEKPTDILDKLQISTVSKILASPADRVKTGRKTDVCIQLPFFHMRLLNPNHESGDLIDTRPNDQYDVRIQQLRATIQLNERLEPTGSPAGHGQHQAVLLSLGHLNIDVSDQAQKVDDADALNIALQEITIRLSLKKRLIVTQFQQRALQITSSVGRIHVLPPLFRRTTNAAEEIAGYFAQPDNAPALQVLAYFLTNMANEAPDPVFLTKPSYVLRTSGKHIRLNDSWKILSRLRAMMRSLDHQQFVSMMGQCRTPIEFRSSDAEAAVINYFDSWRPWDLAHVKKTIVMEEIWRREPNDPTTQRPGHDLLVEVTLGKARLAIEAGPEESAIVVQEIRTVVSAKNVFEKPAEGRNGGVDQYRHIMIQNSCCRLNIHLTWEVLMAAASSHELLGKAQTHIRRPSDEVARHKTKRTSQQRLHLTFGVGSAVMTVEAIHVALVLASSNLRGSLLLWPEAGGMNTSSTLLTASSASAKLEGQGAAVLGLFFQKPTICLSEEENCRRSEKGNKLRATAKCETFSLEMMQDLCSALDLIGRVISDEAAALVKILSHDKSISSGARGNSSSRFARSNNIYVALFVDRYTVAIAILPHLAYVVSGNQARLAATPTSSVSTAVDFEIDSHSHSFELSDKTRLKQVTSLGLPPTTGRVVLSRKPEVTCINVNATVEKIELDARSVRVWVEMANDSRVISTLLKAKRGILRLSSRLDEILPSSSSDSTTVSEHPAPILCYTTNFVLIGLELRASEPALKSKDCRADLQFMLGLTTARVSNRSNGEDILLEHPDFDVALRQVSLHIFRRSLGRRTRYGNVDLAVHVSGRTNIDEENNSARIYHARSDHLDVDIHSETASLLVDIAAHLQERLRAFTLPEEVKRLKPLRRLTVAGLVEPPQIKVTDDDDPDEDNPDEDNPDEDNDDSLSTNLFDSVYWLELNAIKVAWRLGDGSRSSHEDIEDLVFSVREVDLSTKREGSATLKIADLQLQMVPKSLPDTSRSLNSALMPEVVFKAAYLSTKKDRRFAFQAAGKALDLRLTSDWIAPASALRSSMLVASSDLREGISLWTSQPTSSQSDKRVMFGKKYLASLLVDADFAGAVVKVQARKRERDRQSAFGMLKGERRSRAGRYTQAVQGDNANEATLRAPGVAMKIEYSDNGVHDPALNAEIKVAASSNVLYPSVVPLILEISSSVKEMMGNADESSADTSIRRKSEGQRAATNPSTVTNDPVQYLRRYKLNLGLWVKRQEFTLSCQPIARVAATTRFNDIFLAVNTVQALDGDRFFSLSLVFSDALVSIQHIYSREPTASFELDKMVLSVMNSKHTSGETGISAILNLSPMKAFINAKQLQDFLLFRKIWYPSRLRTATPSNTATTNEQVVVVQRYQQAAAETLPWNAVVSVEELNVTLDLGQNLGKSVFTIAKLWASSTKASDLEQNLCIGFDRIGIDSTGRMSGFIDLQNFRIRTSISWPHKRMIMEQTPLVQASLSVGQCRVKAAFEYQPFAIAEISGIEFLMYNVRGDQSGGKDRLVGNLEGETVQVFCTTASASQALGLYQAVERIIQEKRAAFDMSLRELDGYLQRKSIFPTSTWTAPQMAANDGKPETLMRLFTLHTDVVVTLRAVNVGAFPSTFFDNQIFKFEAKEAQARFAVSAKDSQTHSSLALTLGQFRVALASVNRANPRALVDVSVSDVLGRAASSRGGTILKVPKVFAAMETWQQSSSNSIDYIFKSTCEGKVDVGWNYSRISFIRGMWAAHARALASRLGKPLPKSAVQITGVPLSDDEGIGRRDEKITAVVNVPQSRFEYRALQPPVIETPQLRDMGEATPPLEWIGLQRDKLPNVTHQIVIVPLLELAREVEDAYAKILGASRVTR